MTPKERLVAALDRKVPDHLPATTHHLMGTFLDNYMGGCSNEEFFKQMNLDPIVWCGGSSITPEEAKNWIFESEHIEDPEYYCERYYYRTPGGTLTTLMKQGPHTQWYVEPHLKEKKDIELIDLYWPAPVADPAKVAKIAAENPDYLIRGSLFGLRQPGCWADLAALYGIERLIFETYDDPEWVKEALEILQKKKLKYADSLEGCPYDVVEMGGGDASSTVISPAMFDEFVAPYDGPIIKRAQERGQRVVYHTCGGMMPILERLADMGPNALETFTPVGMGGDANLAEAKRRIGDRVCMIGGFDQLHWFNGCTPEETRRQVRRCFEEAGEGGGFIIAPSDHFFDADPELIRAFADEAIKCVY